MNQDLTFDLSGRVALVTGSSRGIGAGILGVLARRGARCIVNYVADPQGRNKADAERVAASLHNPQDARVIECDVSSYEQVGKMMATIAQDFGGLDILVNNAGILRDRSLKKMTFEDWDVVLRVNLTGTFNCIQQSIPILRRDGRIVNIASMAGALGIFGQANYASSKAGIMALTRVTATELARQNITVNAVAPGVVDTEMGRQIPEEARQKLLAQVPLQRFAAVGDIVNAVLFLCSPFAGYITGQVLHVNGGMYMP